MRLRVLGLVTVLAACQDGSTDDLVDSDPGVPWPEPDAWGGTTGPGAPRVTFTEAQLGQACAALPGMPGRDEDHHDGVGMFDGYLVLPWAPEWGSQKADLAGCGITGSPTVDDPMGIEDCPGVFGGGITLWDVADPCSPTKVGEAWSPWMRESHTLAFATVGDRTYLAVDYLEPDGSGGVGFWDLTDPTAPFWAGQVKVPDHDYPDSYLRLTLSTAWQYPYVYAATATVGVGVIDATDPTQPAWVDTLTFEGIHQAGSFLTWGNRAMNASAGLARTLLMDTSDPVAPTTLFGGDFEVTTEEGQTSSYYFSNLGAHYGLFASSLGGGSGPVIVDLADPTAPVTVGSAINEEGEGGYIFQHEDKLFMGESNFGRVYDFADPANPTPLLTVDMQGDFDFFTPMGSVAVGSVDDDPEPGKASLVFPWSAEPDTRPPTAGMTSPMDGETRVAITGRVGVVLDEMIEPKSAFPGSFRVEADDGTHVDGVFQVTENVVNFMPSAPLQAGTTYAVTLPAGGLVDLTGNALAEDVSFSFTTAD